MRKTLFALILAAAVILPSTALAGDGAAAWYGPWFNDREEHDGYPVTFDTWIWAHNPNSYSSTIKIIYYKTDGSKYAFGGYSTFTHTIAANASTAWRPNNDIGQSTSEILKGSYEIIATDGSVNVMTSTTTYAGDVFDNITSIYYDANFSEGDPLRVVSIPCQTATATHLTMEGFIQYDPNDDNVATDAGERVTWISIANPSDQVEATVVMKMYDLSGTAQTIDPYDDDGDNDSTTATISLNRHGSSAFTPGYYGVGISSKVKGSVVLDVVKGSVVAHYAVYCCDENSSTELKNFRGYGETFHKRSSIK